ncbi:MAG TPA: gephyrin-like molybdotransferase Glp [Thermoleophilaceae bacterium]|nr:gephyrin-like molybdotransferase Glp [Thermoleophilaceae bacterium]
MAELIAIDEARRLVLEEVRPLPAETVRLMDALGRVLWEEVASPLDVPPLESSAMDGYAVAAGPAGELPVVGESRAGHPFGGALQPGTAIRISTGAEVPEGANAVVPVERTGQASSNGAVELPDTAAGENVRHAGEDMRAGEVVLRPGTMLGPAEVAVAASLGRAELSCSKRPRLALVVTGDELAEPGQPLGPGRIYSSNTWALAGQARAAGAEPKLSETVPDEPGATRAALERAIEGAEVVCVSGGVSVGPHDHVKPALEELGVEERFWGVRLKPGKPTWFGVRDGLLAFGLPGNPVSAMVTFQLFVRPALLALQGASPEPRRAEAELAHPVARNERRDQVLRVRLEETHGGGRRAALTGGQDSHMLTSMLGADALALIPAGEGELAAGERVELELL